MGWVSRFLQFSSSSFDLSPTPVPGLGPLPRSLRVDEVTPEPSRGWEIWIPRQRVCVRRRERGTKGREVRSSYQSRRWGAPGGEKGA